MPSTRKRTAFFIAVASVLAVAVAIRVLVPGGPDAEGILAAYRPDAPVFNRAVSLRDSWAKIVKKGG